MLIGWQALRPAGSGGAAGSPVGLLLAVGALAAWTVFAVGNGRSVQCLQGLSPQDWNLLAGPATGLVWERRGPTPVAPIT